MQLGEMHALRRLLCSVLRHQSRVWMCVFIRLNYLLAFRVAFVQNMVCVNAAALESERERDLCLLYPCACAIIIHKEHIRDLTRIRCIEKVYSAAATAAGLAFIFKKTTHTLEDHDGIYSLYTRKYRPENYYLENVN